MSLGVGLPDPLSLSARVREAMNDPKHLFVLEDQTTIFEDGFGETDATTVAVADYYGDHEYPDTGEPAYKCRGSHGDVYIPTGAVTSILDLTDATEYGQAEETDPAIVPVPDVEYDQYRSWKHGPIESEEVHRASIQDGPEIGFGLGFVRVYDGGQEQVVELDSMAVARLLAAAVGFEQPTRPPGPRQ